MTTLALIEVVHALRAARDNRSPGAGVTRVATFALDDVLTVSGAVGVAIVGAGDAILRTPYDWLPNVPCVVVDELARIFLAAGHEDTARIIMAQHRTVPEQPHVCEIDRPERIIGAGNSGG